MRVKQVCLQGFLLILHANSSFLCLCPWQSKGQRDLASRQAFWGHDLLSQSSVPLVNNQSLGLRTLRRYSRSSKLHMTRFPKPQFIINNEYLSNTCSGLKLVPNTPYSSALHLPRWNLTIQSQACNYRPGSDHHYLAKDADSPAAIHGNISQAMSQELADYQAMTPCALAPLPPHTKKRLQ